MCQKPGTLYLHVCYGVLYLQIDPKYNLSITPALPQPKHSGFCRHGGAGRLPALSV